MGEHSQFADSFQPFTVGDFQLRKLIRQVIRAKRRRVPVRPLHVGADFTRQAMGIPAWQIQREEVQPTSTRVNPQIS